MESQAEKFDAIDAKLVDLGERANRIAAGRIRKHGVYAAKPHQSGTRPSGIGRSQDSR